MWPQMECFQPKPDHNHLASWQKKRVILKDKMIACTIPEISMDGLQRQLSISCPFGHDNKNTLFPSDVN